MHFLARLPAASLLQHRATIADMMFNPHDRHGFVRRAASECLERLSEPASAEPTPAESSPPQAQQQPPAPRPQSCRVCRSRRLRHSMRHRRYHRRRQHRSLPRARLDVRSQRSGVVRSSVASRKQETSALWPNVQLSSIASPSGFPMALLLRKRSAEDERVRSQRRRARVARDARDRSGRPRLRGGEREAGRRSRSQSAAACSAQ